ncbi:MULTISPECIES: Lrp/AsnC family transcriptional regulator [Achromobacter]|uniref:Lrp/AsnC family transcriptional regulator n=1 Tax=Achromobacter aegrifaciens TaxID=1287736 RepID=A0AAD2IXY6_ACHAE|nr:MULTISPECIES: Lrp/AsnC family transcriptional regulator [Achromobacter]PTN51580.1 Lrp/AsnC family transcriptional regulator [Achromobacter xylosoxidans]MBD9382657.1 Lrp/AsnC family transcriptional regulator [Achromobacter sp. ACM02]MBD9420632.1 Lrp/AsnC family transcriptional regulator [Achromobacter sp. ACM04]MBD9430516.1 Lrp/AsnC family transcriptional regulator [Achromobacter sp. ACM03]MBD9472072.1 Lrp/AsnC family transcriptional regulator [Achromobacter sp. ACM01]
MDEIDTRLIGILRRDARTPLSVLASKAGVSRGTVSNRLRKLEEDGLIAGYTLKLRPDSDQDGLRAWMGITVDGNQTRAVLASLLGEPSVEQLHDTNGRWDLLAEIRADSTADLSKVLERVRLIKGIAATETSILLATYR